MTASIPLSPAAIQSSSETAAYYRLTSITRLPGKGGRGVTNIATLYHEQGAREVTWQSTQVDCRLKRGYYVVMRGIEYSATSGNTAKIQRLDLLDKPQPTVNPFDTVPANWVRDRALVTRASNLWRQLSRPLQHLVSAVLWDGCRFERFVTGPAALSCYPPLPNANLNHAVETAEHTLMLANGLTDVSTSVLIAAALLHDAGKADDFRLNPDRDGYSYSERGVLVGARHTVLEWLAVARGRDGVIVPDGHYLALIHALTASRGAAWLGIREPQIIEATILAVADRACSEAACSPNLSLERRPVHSGGVR